MTQSGERQGGNPLQELFGEIAPEVRSLNDVSRDNQEPVLRVFEKAVLAIARKHFMYRSEETPQSESSKEADLARRSFILPTGGFGQASSQEELDFLVQTFGVQKAAFMGRQKTLAELFDMVSKGTRELNYFIEPERSITAINQLEDITLYLADAVFAPLTGEAELTKHKLVYLPTHVVEVEVAYESGVSFLEQHLGAVLVSSTQARFTKALTKDFPLR